MFLRILVVASSCFLVVKLLFSFLGWYSKDQGDKLYRQSLDVLWDRLQQLSLSQVFILALSRLADRVRHTFRTTANALTFALLTAFVLSIATALPVLTLLVWDAPAFVWNDMPFTYVLGWVAWFVWEGQSPPLLAYWILTWTLIGTASTIITWVLVNRAVRAKSVSTAFAHIGLNILVTLAAIGLLYAAMIGSVLIPDYHYYGEFSQHLAFHTLILEERTPGVLMSIVLLFGAVAALPSLIYLLICVWVIVLRLLPDAVRRFIMRVVYLVTTDKDPVLQTIGNLFGGLAAICGGIVATLK